VRARNADGAGAREFHDRTAHSFQSIRASRHTLDWDNKPLPFKIYPDLPAMPLPRDLPALAADVAPALIGGAVAASGLDLERLAALLYYAAGVTKVKRYPGGGEVYFRAAASTGALYQTEVYLVTGALAGLPAGVYHFGPGDFALRRLREGDFRGALALAAAAEDLAASPAILVLSGLYWRNTWKYQARGYRHLFWDSGTLLANLLAAAAALGVPARLVTGFVDLEVNALLGLDAETEGALVLAPLGIAGTSGPPSPVISPLDAATVPLSASRVDYPLLVEAYRDSSLESEAEVAQWREEAGLALPPSAPPASSLVALPPPAARMGRALGETIERRGSTREFSGESIDAERFSTALYHATRGVALDVPGRLVDLYLAVHAVDGIPPGAYAYHPDRHALETLARGDVRADSAYLCLGQPLGGASSATAFFLSDLRSVLARLGNRGYRLANLEAGIAGGRLYLGAYAQGFGASGLTFYDRAVVEFFGPHAAGKDAIFVTALGRSVRGPAREPAPLQIHPKT